MKPTRQKPIIVSSCLLGLDCRYNGLCKKNDSVINSLAEGGWTIIPVCPEQLAGLPTPRPATQFSSGNGDTVLSGNGSIVNSHHENMDEVFVKGAHQVLAIARMNHCVQAIFKERSPSCGVHQIYLKGQIVSGRGVTTALLEKNGIAVFNEDETDMIQNPTSTGND